MEDDRPFNPFYIGPHPSMACAVTETPPRQCSPDCAGKEDAASSSGAQGTDKEKEKANSEPPCQSYPCKEGRN
ncbi:hypothetical protein ACLKA6_009790 [Drosophila palustris]